MIFIRTSEKLRGLAIAVLCLQAFALLFCGDVDCLQGEGDAVCQTILCSLLDDHDHSQPPFSPEDSCQGACYLSYDLPEINPFSDTLVSTYFFLDTQVFLSTPTSGIDHIPRC